MFVCGKFVRVLLNSTLKHIWYRPRISHGWMSIPAVKGSCNVPGYPDEGFLVREHLLKLYGRCGLDVDVRRQGAAALDNGRCEQSVVNVQVSWFVAIGWI